MTLFLNQTKQLKQQRPSKDCSGTLLLGILPPSSLNFAKEMLELIQSGAHFVSNRGNSKYIHLAIVFMCKTAACLALIRTIQTCLAGCNRCLPTIPWGFSNHLGAGWFNWNCMEDAHAHLHTLPFYVLVPFAKVLILHAASPLVCLATGKEP